MQEGLSAKAKGMSTEERDKRKKRVEERERKYKKRVHGGNKNDKGDMFDRRCHQMCSFSSFSCVVAKTIPRRKQSLLHP